MFMLNKNITPYNLIRLICITYMFFIGNFKLLDTVVSHKNGRIYIAAYETLLSL